MAFGIKAKINDIVIWEYQWATVPSIEQIEEVTLDAPCGDRLWTGRHANSIYRGIIYIRNEFAVNSVNFESGLVVEKV